jgi:uncharacterized protein
MRPCPICKKPSERARENPYAPFCSQRCKLVDLGNWLAEGYRIAEPESAAFEEASDDKENGGTA